MNTVLVVDDEELVRRALVQTLERHGFQCRSASGVADALRAVRESEPAVILLNASLGLESGLELHRTLRTSHGPTPAVVFITGRRDLYTEFAERMGPADDWIGKPWDQSELIARVHLALVRSSAIPRPVA